MIQWSRLWVSLGSAVMNPVGRTVAGCMDLTGILFRRWLGRLGGITKPKSESAKAGDGEKDARRFHNDSRRIEVAVGVCRVRGPGRPF